MVAQGKSPNGAQPSEMSAIPCWQASSRHFSLKAPHHSPTVLAISHGMSLALFYLTLSVAVGAAEYFDELQEADDINWVVLGFNVRNQFSSIKLNEPIFKNIWATFYFHVKEKLER